MPLDVLPEVAAALTAGEAVVALETTLICHGIPRPRNLTLGREIEQTVRRAGAIPATIGLLDGRLKIGLPPEALERMATTDDVVKASARDLAWVMASGRPGATTVAGTIYAASRAGIRVMATGGLGGVHRGGQSSLDISADLHELARCPVVVVCSGAKSILDLPRTLEVIETLGITVLGLGTDELPAFYCRSSGLKIPAVDSVRAAAEVARVQAEIGRGGAIVLANPPPARLALAHAEVEAMVRDALAAARREGIGGKDETPFMLAHMARASGGRTVNLNEQLVLDNASVAARLAAAMI
jgi:pseudouridine-5'-phosphate glycosidase